MVLWRPLKGRGSGLARARMALEMRAGIKTSPALAWTMLHTATVGKARRPGSLSQWVVA